MSDGQIDNLPYQRSLKRRSARGDAPERTSRAGDGPSLTERIDRASAAYERAAKPFIVQFFIFLLILPVSFALGPIRLTFPRLFLLVMFVPLIVRWLMGRYGGIIAADLLLVAHAAWHFLIISFHHGVTKASEFSTVAAVELLGAYFLARVYIRDRTSFLFFAKCAFWTLVVLLPFAMIESLTRQMLISNIIGAIPGLTAFENVGYEPRMGLYRAQVTFEHPILFGVFCSSLFSVAWFALSRPDASLFARGMRAFFPFLGTFFSLSSGALVSILVQGILIGWDFVTKTLKKRWNILALIFLAMYVTIDLLSNRSPAQIFISFGTFNSATAWNRILIWEYGSAEVIRNPIFGLGLKDWQRPHWMVASTDNYWLLVAMRFGLPGFALMASAFFLAMRGVAKMDFGNRPELLACQKAYMTSVFGTFIAMCTVHMWGGTFLFVVFMLASGIWMFTQPEDVGPRRRGAAARGDDGDDAREASSERSTSRRRGAQENRSRSRQHGAATRRRGPADN